MQQTSGQQLRAALKAAKLTQKQLATKYGIPLRTVEEWVGNRRTPGYVLDLLLRCMAIDFPPVAQVLSEKEPEPITEPVPVPVQRERKSNYTLHTDWGKRLTPEQTNFVEGELAGGRTAVVGESDDGSGWVQFRCETDGNIYEKRPVKEV